MKKEIPIYRWYDSLGGGWLFFISGETDSKIMDFFFLCVISIWVRLVCRWKCRKVKKKKKKGSFHITKYNPRRSIGKKSKIVVPMLDSKKRPRFGSKGFRRVRS